LPKVDLHLEPGPLTLAREVWGIGAAPADWLVDQSFTGKTYARLDTAVGIYYLRGLPDGTSGRWLTAVHDAVDYLRRHGFGLVPRFLATDSGETVVRHHGRLYDLAAWAVGEAVDATDLTATALTNLGETIGRLHRAGKGAPGPPARLDWLPDRVRTSMRLAWDPVPRGRDSWQTLENLAAFFRPLLLADSPTLAFEAPSKIVSIANSSLDWLERSSLGADLTAGPPTLTHGDLWADHVRFSGDAVTSLIDVDTLALRPPLGDLAALCADFGFWDPERCGSILLGYRRCRTVTPEQVGALPVLGARRIVGILRSRLRAWLNPTRQRGEAEAVLDGPVPYWLDQLQTLSALNLATFQQV
jgi:Ser/Thr protein kinase RdoA (MazF antagonist)